MFLTRQRRIIIEELKKIKTHPTADEFYVVLKKRLPKLSLGSVYRNLELLSSCGMLIKLETGGSRKRFDGDLSPHYHVKCTNCGGISDFSNSNLVKAGKMLERVLEEESLKCYSLEFSGLCVNCRRPESLTA